MAGMAVRKERIEILSEKSNKFWLEEYATF